MKKIVFILTIVLTFCFLSTAYCMSDISAIVNTDGIMNIDISSDFGEANYTIYILKPGYDIDSIASGETQAFLGVEEIISLDKEDLKNLTDSSSFTFDINEEKGTYLVVVGGGELYGNKVYVTYPSKDTETNAATDLKAATLSSFESVLLSAEYQSKAWYIDTSDETYLSNKKTVLENMYYILKDTDYKTDDVTRAYKRALVIEKLKSADNNNFYDILFVNKSNLNITYPEFAYEQKAEFANAFKNICKEKTVNTPSQLENALKDSEAVAKVNLSVRDTIIDTLKDYNNIFELDFTGDFAKVDSYSLSKLISAKIPYQSISDIKSTFSLSVSSLITPSSSSGGGSVSTVSGGKNASYTGFGADTSLTSPMIQKVEEFKKADDLSDAEWARPYIEYLNKNNIMSGDGNGNFRPNDFIKKEEFLKLVCETLKVQQSDDGDVLFDDVKKEEWYYTYVQRAVKQGIVKGKSESIFGAGEYLTRQDAAVMTKRAIDTQDASLQNAQATISFADEQNISDYAKEAVDYLVECAILNGNENGEFLPCKSLTRAEAAKIIYSVIKAIIS